MPLVKTEEVKKDRYIALWHIKETVEELLFQLNPIDSDRQLMLSFKSEKKQLEWLAGRMTIKKLAGELGLVYEGIIKNDIGKPFLRSHKHEISLTHSYPYVAAIIDPEIGVGIDLEQPKEKLIRVAEKFLSHKEMNYAGNDINKLCLMWCAKETLYKIYGETLLFRENMLIEPFVLENRGRFTGNIIVNGKVESHKLECRMNEKYILTFNI